MTKMKNSFTCIFFSLILMLATGIISCTSEDPDFAETNIFAIKVEDSFHGAVTLASTSAAAGRTVTVNAVPEPGYDFSSMTITPSNKNIKKIQVTENKFVMPDSDVTIKVYFKTLNYSVSISSDSNGKVELENTSVVRGTKVHLIVTPKSGYKLKSLTVEDSNDLGLGIWTRGSHSFIMPAEDVTVNAEFEPGTAHSITCDSTIAAGTISTIPASSATAGTTVKVSANPTSGYQMKSFSVTHNGVLVQVDEENGSFIMPDGDVVVSATIPAGMTVTAKIPASLNEDMHEKGEGYTVTHQLWESDLTADATTSGFNKNLALVSMTGCAQLAKENNIRKFYSDLGFDNIEARNYFPTSTYEESKITDSISWCFAHKTMGGREVIGVSVRGLGCLAEWGSNFKFGVSGDHEGFLLAAERVHAALCNYIAKNYSSAYENEEITLWVFSYSRGAAVSNILSYLMMTREDTKLNIAPKHMHVYTFGTPRGLTKEHVQPYSNVFNVLSLSDAVAHIAPEAYGLYRCGTDIELFSCNNSDYKKHTKNTVSGIKTYYTTKVDEYLLQFDPNIVFHPFLIQYGDYKNQQAFPYTNEIDFMNYIFGLLMEKDGMDTRGAYSAFTRRQYAENMQNSISYAMQLIFPNLSNFSKIADNLMSDKNLQNNWFSSEASFYFEIKGRLEEYGIEFNDTKLYETSIATVDMIDFYDGNGALTSFFFTILTNNIVDNKDLLRSFQTHYPEVTYVLLTHYGE